MSKTTTTKKTTLIQTRISLELKQQAEIMLESIGLSINDFVRVSVNNFVNNGQINLQANTPKVLTEEDFAPETWQRILKAQEEVNVGDVYKKSQSKKFDEFLKSANL